MKEDLKLINSSKNIFLLADKTQNFYEIKKEDYEKIVHENVTKKYKKANMSLPKRINREARKIIKTFDAADRVDTMAKQECFITLKDHEEDDRTNPKYHLLNPTKSQLGKIRKQILKKVIAWFKNIQQKISHTFTVFDIQECYQSITEKLLKDALAFAQKYVEIKQNKLDLIFHTGKSLLYCKDTP